MSGVALQYTAVSAVIRRYSSVKSYPGLVRHLGDITVRGIILTHERKYCSMSFSGACVGIDLGTNYNCVALWENDHVEIIANDQGVQTIPSYVAFYETEILVGDAAKDHAAINSSNTVFGVTSLIGRKFTDDDVQCERRRLPFTIVGGPDTKPLIEVVFQGETTHYSAEEILTLQLVHIKELAETHLGREVTNAVLTVPVQFDEPQRQAMQNAGERAGLRVTRVLREPVAAVLAYGLHHAIPPPAYRQYHCQSHEPQEEAVRRVVVFDLEEDCLTVTALSVEEGVVDVDGYLSRDIGQGGHTGGLPSLQHTLVPVEGLGGEDGEMSVCAPRPAETTGPVRCVCDQCVVSSCVEMVERVLGAAGRLPEEVQHVVLVGRGSLLPHIYSALQAHFPPGSLLERICPIEVVARGAALVAGLLYVAERREGELTGVDALPLSLGVRTAGGAMTPLLLRHTTIPCRRTQTFAMAGGGARGAVLIDVYEGERVMSADNDLLGSMCVENLTPPLTVTFDMDPNEVLHVTVTGAGGGRGELCIENSRGRWSRGRVDRLLEEARWSTEGDELSRIRAIARARGTEGSSSGGEESLTAMGLSLPLAGMQDQM